MDWESGRAQLEIYIKKYRYILLVFVCGIIIMLLPERNTSLETEIPPAEEAVPNLQVMLEETLIQIKGVGQVKVLLTEANGTNTIYQTDGDVGQNNSRQDTVIITNGGREENGLVRQVNPPVYRGAVVVCQGADSAGVRLAVVDAVRCVTGLSSDCITVLKMK